MLEELKKLKLYPTVWLFEVDKEFSIDNQILIFTSNKEDKQENKQLLQKRETFIQEKIERQMKFRNKRKRTKLELLEKFIKRNPNSGSVTFSGALDPVQVNKNAEISASENFKKKVVEKNKEVISKFWNENIRYEKQHRFIDPDSVNGSSYERLKLRFHNVLNAPFDYQQYKRHIPVSTKERTINNERLDQMFKVYCNSGFPDQLKGKINMLTINFI